MIDRRSHLGDGALGFLRRLLAGAGAAGDSEQEQTLARHVEAERIAERLVLVVEIGVPVQQYQSADQTHDSPCLLQAFPHPIGHLGPPFSWLRLLRSLDCFDSVDSYDFLG